MRITLAIILFIFVVSACDTEKLQSETKTGVDSLAIQLSMSATERYGEYIFGRINSPDSLELSLNELDKAIEIEPNLLELYTAKVNILLELDRNEQAIEVSKEVLAIKPDQVEAMTFIGFINEKIGKNELAQEWYQRALVAYDKRIEENRFVVNSKVNKVFLLLFTENEESAKKAYFKLKKEYPENNDIDYLEFVFEDFDKQEFLNEFHK
ncbi:MAG: hypothetical protein ABJI69_06155 [Balneola sp.]|jgi:tetratricopeptide (TPR) repeat protein